MPGEHHDAVGRVTAEVIRHHLPAVEAEFYYCGPIGFMTVAEAGVILAELVPAMRQPVQFFPTCDPVLSARTMAALDTSNARFGRGTLQPLATGIARPWQEQARNLLPRYTTRAAEMLVARAW